jgi:molybdate/tungstate transport system substrate-binding protein
MKPFSALIAVSIISLFLGNSCTGSFSEGIDRTPVVVFAAGSLIIPFSHLEKAFESKYPEIDVQAQYHGSIQVIRHVTDLHIPIDVIATADASLLPILMYTAKDPETSVPYADWYMRFASNHIALAYQPGSKYTNEINGENWFDILTRPDVRVGFADPRFDAIGYRTLMVYALARDYYHDPNIFTDMFKNQFTFPLGIFNADTLTTITVPEIMETRVNSHIILRGASIELIALLESGDLDYSFEYESVIQQHQLNLLMLPDELNLGSEAYQQGYSIVQVDEDFQRFASVSPVFRGEQIGYGITIPSNAPHPGQAALFIKFLLSPEGRSTMLNDSQPVFEQILCDNYTNIPAELQSQCTLPRSP